jgi:PIN domain nuclease of toxin-antitoxin system
VTPTTSQVVADTHVLVWYLTDSGRLSASALQALEAGVADGHPIVVNSISLVEVVYAVEKGRDPLTADQRDYIFEILDRDDSSFIVVPTSPAVARAMAAIDRERLPDPADRSVAGTALAMELPLVSADNRLRKAGEAGVLNVIW